MSPETPAAEFTRLLDHLKASRGFDFSAYKVSSLMRRIQKRMREVGVESYSGYSDYLEVHPHEFGPLFDTVLINVTSFFRDADAWQYLAEHIVPRILDEVGNERPIRVWSAACASGEEAFSVAMLLAEALSEDEFRQRVKIYATDADEGALSIARQGCYEPRHVSSLPPAMLEKYFTPSGSRHQFRPELRRCLIFGRHDLIQDPAISHLDLLICRNVLMYFNAEAQQKILARFHFALNRSGFLFLGKAETLLTQSDTFRPVDLRHRVFARTPSSSMRDRLLALAQPTVPGEAQGGTRHGRIREAAWEASPVAQLVLDRRGHLVLANDRARRLVHISSAEVGRLFQDLEISYRPVELRSHVEEAQATRSAVRIRDVEWRGGTGEARLFEIQVVPLYEVGGGPIGTSISFVDLTAFSQLRNELERAHQELETAYEELQSANEELETTNEELQSTVEELETTNEELQSANEELETMNEELQSTNEELRTINDRLGERSEELDHTNGYLENILTSVRAAVVVLDRGLHVSIWSRKAEDLWGFRTDEVKGQPFLEVDIGLPVQELQHPLFRCLSGGEESEVELDGINRRGRPVRYYVRCTPLLGRGVEGVIVFAEAKQETDVKTA